MFISERHADELQKVEVLEGDVLLNITGDSVARVCQVTQDVLPARVNQHVAIIRPDSVSLDASYLRYYRASPEMQTLLLSWAGSGGTRNALTKGMLESLVIPTPPLPEQRAIVHILDTLDDKIELNPREPMQKGTAAPYLEMAALPTTGSSPDDTVLRGFKSGARFRNGDTLLARDNTLFGKRQDHLSPVTTKGRCWLEFNRVHRHACNSPLPAEYLYLLSREEGFREHAIQSMTGTSGRQRVQVDALASYLLPFPPGDVWAVFPLSIGPIFAEIEITRKESHSLAVQRDVLLPKLVSGELRLGEPTAPLAALPK